MCVYPGNHAFQLWDRICPPAPDPLLTPTEQQASKNPAEENRSWEQPVPFGTG